MDDDYYYSYIITIIHLLLFISLYLFSTRFVLSIEHLCHIANHKLTTDPSTQITTLPVVCTVEESSYVDGIDEIYTESPIVFSSQTSIGQPISVGSVGTVGFTVLSPLHLVLCSLLKTILPGYMSYLRKY